MDFDATKYDVMDGVTAMSFIKRNNAMLFLFFNALMWGSSYVWSKMLLSYLPRFSILLLCSLGGVGSICILFFRRLRLMQASAILPSLAVSSFSILSNTFFMLALQYTSSSNTAFIVQTSVIFTPLITALLDGKMPQRKVFGGALTAMGGLFLLTCDFHSFGLNTGDLLALCNALFFSLFLTGQNRISGKVEPVHFSFIHYIFNSLVFAVLAGMLEWRSIRFEGLASPVFVILAVVSMLISVVTVLFQSAAVKHIRPERATLIYTLEPVTALILGWAFMGEQPDGLKSAAGCLLILTAIILSVYRPAPRVARAVNSRIRISKEAGKAADNGSELAGT